MEYDVKIAKKIEQVYRLQAVDDTVSYNEIEMAFCCSQYYTKPCNVDRMYDKFAEYYQKEVKRGSRAKDNVRANIYLKIIKEYFDYAYFKERLAHHKKHRDEECILEFMLKFDTFQLQSFLPVVMGCILIFSRTDKRLEILCDKFNEACLQKGEANPDIKPFYDKHGCFDVKFPVWFFERLDKWTIVDIFYKNIAEDKKHIVGRLAELMYFEGLESVEEMVSVWYCDCSCPE